MTTYRTTCPSPLGELRLAGDGEALTALYLPDHAGSSMPEMVGRDDPGPFATVVAELEAWFAGERTCFEVPLAPAGTPFQQEVWGALRAIPYGQTRGYGELAASVGRPGAARAVGLANGRNPISVIVPCHRVIGVSGALTGYGGGVERKRWLLDHERSVLSGSLF